MKPGDLVISLKDYEECIKDGAIFTPFVPKKDTICTVESLLGNGGFLLEEVKVKDYTGQPWGFWMKGWRKLDTISSNEVFELCKEAQENYQLQEIN